MPKNEKKTFSLDSKRAFIIYLERLIMDTHKFFKKQRVYLDELKGIIAQHGIEEQKDKRIPASTYQDINSKIQYMNCNLFNIIGDHTTTAMSYKKFRAYAERQNKHLNLGLLALDVSIVEIINEMNVNRNWGLHLPESLLVASREILDKAVKKDGEKYKFENVNPIKIIEFEYYEGEWLISLYNESDNLSTGFRKVLQQMKKDYSILIGESVTIEVARLEVRPLADMDVPKISFEIQNNKYNGIDDRSIWFGDDTL